MSEFKVGCVYIHPEYNYKMLVLSNRSELFRVLFFNTYNAFVLDDAYHASAYEHVYYDGVEILPSHLDMAETERQRDMGFERFVAYFHRKADMFREMATETDIKAELLRKTDPWL